MAGLDSNYSSGHLRVSVDEIKAPQKVGLSKVTYLRFISDGARSSDGSCGHWRHRQLENPKEARQRHGRSDGLGRVERNLFRFFLTETNAAQ